jgi:hypothetical protein
MIDRGSASRLTRLAQGGAVGALALSAVAAFVALPGGSPPAAPTSMEIPPPVIKEDRTDTPAARIDGAHTGARISLVSNTPKPPVVEPVKPPDPEVAPPAPVSDITYHGIVSMGSKSMGLIKFNGKQRFVRVGDKVDNQPVEEVVPEHVRLGPSRIIPLADRTGGVVSRFQNAGPVMATMNMSQDVMNMVTSKAQMAAAIKGGMVPPYVPRDDAMLWRKNRARLILSGQHNLADNLDELAAKTLDDLRSEYKGDAPLTADELDAEMHYLSKQGHNTSELQELRGKP